MKKIISAVIQLIFLLSFTVGSAYALFKDTAKVSFSLDTGGYVKRILDIELHNLVNQPFIINTFMDFKEGTFGIYNKPTSVPANIYLYIRTKNKKECDGVNIQILRLISSTKKRILFDGSLTDLHKQSKLLLNGHKAVQPGSTIELTIIPSISGFDNHDWLRGKEHEFRKDDNDEHGIGKGLHCEWNSIIYAESNIKIKNQKFSDIEQIVNNIINLSKGEKPNHTCKKDNTPEAKDESFKDLTVPSDLDFEVGTTEPQIVIDSQNTLNITPEVPKDE
jgi:hypothetical protein